MQPPDLAIIVTSYQMPWHIRRVLESIAAQRTSRRLEVVVSDDGSTDETPQVVADFAAGAAFPVRFVTHPHTEFHAARCRNEGARLTTAPRLHFVDGDCLLPPNHLEQHLAAAGSGVVTCGYCVRMEQAVTQHVTLDVVRSGKFVEWATAEQRRELRQMHFKAGWYSLIGHPMKPPLRSGDFAMSRADYERINGFDENFRGWGCEDDDFGRRLRASGVRLVSILNRTYLYHLWHPPAPTRPEHWKKGSNVAYLQRPLRLTRCVNGMTKRTPQELTVRLVDEAVGGAPLHALLKAHGWIIETSRKIKTDLELRCIPGRGQFTARTDCRVLAVFDESLFDRNEGNSAHIVLSPSGQIGRRHQVRLRLDDVDGFWAVLHGVGVLQQRAAA